MQDSLEKVGNNILEEANSILGYTFSFTKEISISFKGLLFIILALVVSSIVLKFIRRLVTKKLPENDKHKFVTVFTYLKWFVYLIIFLFAMHASGVNVTAVFETTFA